MNGRRAARMTLEAETEADLKRLRAAVEEILAHLDMPEGIEIFLE